VPNAPEIGTIWARPEVPPPPEGRSLLGSSESASAPYNKTSTIWRRSVLESDKNGRRGCESKRRRPIDFGASPTTNSAAARDLRAHAPPRLPSAASLRRAESARATESGLSGQLKQRAAYRTMLASIEIELELHAEAPAIGRAVILTTNQ